MITALLVVLLAPPALGLIELPIRFFGTDRAPTRVIREFTSLDSGAPPRMAPEAVASEARIVTDLELAGRIYRLYVAPTRGGGYCYAWRGAFGGCDRLGTTPLSLTIARNPDLLGGQVSAEYVDAVEVVRANGDVVRPEIVWVSEPIDTGFFLLESPKRETPPTVIALRNNREVVREELGQTRPAGPPQLADLERAVEQLRIETRDGPARVVTAPSRTGGRCAWIEFLGRYFFTNASGCLPRGHRPTAVWLRVLRSKRSSLVIGTLAPPISKVEVSLARGGSVRLRGKRGFLLSTLPTRSDRAVEAVLYRREQVVTRFPILPATPVSRP